MARSSSKPPKDYLALRDAIARKHDSLSKRLKQIASFALDHPTEMAMETIVVIAKDAGVQPSAMIRFANSFGYSGFSEMQRTYRTYVAKRSANYKERIRTIVETGESPEKWTNKELLQKFCTTIILSLESLSENAELVLLNRATKIMRKADRIYIIGQRRSFPVATYLAYTLNHSQCKAHLLDGQGGLLTEQSSTMAKKDVLIAITFHPYAEETRDIVNGAIEMGIKTILITDSSLNPFANKVDVCFQVHDAELLSFRSLATAMCLAQTLATSLLIKSEADSH